MAAAKRTRKTRRPASEEVTPGVRIERSIYVIRGERVMLDGDLADLYGVTTGNLNKAVKRNRIRFPADFMFQLTTEEFDILRFHFGRASSELLTSGSHEMTGSGARAASLISLSGRFVPGNLVSPSALSFSHSWEIPNHQKNPGIPHAALSSRPQRPPTGQLSPHVRMSELSQPRSLGRLPDCTPSPSSRLTTPLPHRDHPAEFLTETSCSFPAKD